MAPLFSLHVKMRIIDCTDDNIDSKRSSVVPDIQLLNKY